MKSLVFIVLLLACQQKALAQIGSEWVSFQDRKTELWGYRDAQGKVRVAPRFLSAPHVFENIASIEESGDGPDKNSEYIRSCYLLKNGRHIGADSVFMEDNTPGCESEGFIRFHDHATDKMGFFDGQGRVAIPAAYNYVDSFHNGVALALRGARKMCWEGKEYDPRHPCEHSVWKGGQTVLINKQNQVLLENLDENQVRSLNWHTLQVNATGLNTAFYAAFRGTDGRQYAFIDSKKEFREWFYSHFLPSCSAATLGGFCFDGLAWWGKKGWKYQPKADFLAGKARLVAQKMAEIRAGKYQAQLFDDNLSPFLFFGRSMFARYVDGCGRHKSSQYPVFSVTVTHPAGPRDSYQEHFDFLRTDDGYQLISVSLEAGR